MKNLISSEVGKARVISGNLKRASNLLFCTLESVKLFDIVVFDISVLKIVINHFYLQSVPNIVI